ncbi:hypothetical protein VXM60_13265 [Shewanella khirikhana]|uniref:hypothetical protein n=1 Tax=Shewanella khirikhana TaxID=1965282 RepID=UPI0030D233E9
MKLMINFYLILVFFLFTFGQLEVMVAGKITNLTYVVILTILICKFFINRKAVRNAAAYNFLFIFILAPFLLLSYAGDLVQNISRWSWFILIALLPLHAFVFPHKYTILLKPILTFYFWLGIVIIFDCILFFIFGNVYLFDFEFYITPRFSGPFNDPNFLGFIYSLIFLLSYIDSSKVKAFQAVRLVSIILVLLSGSVSAIVFLFVSIVLGKLKFTLSPNRIFFASAFFSFVIIPSLIYYSDLLFIGFSGLVGIFFDLPKELVEVKYLSLKYRFEVVNLAVKFISENPFGYGYRSLLDFLPRDTHNSFVGMSFEYGIVTLFFLFFGFYFCNKRRANLAVVAFVSLMPLMLNIHYSPMYLCSIVLLVSFSKFNGSVSNRFNS